MEEKQKEVDLKVTQFGAGEEEEVYMASQWQLVWWRFRRHRLAMGALIVLIIFYGVALFADFFAPYRMASRHRGYLMAPPTPIRFVDEDGFSLRPFVYGLDLSIDMRSGRRDYTIDRDVKHPIYFFVRGEEYELWGLFESDLHLFGTEEGGKVFLLGTDTMGRDLFSQLVFGARVSLSLALIGVILSIVLGIIIGGISGYFGGQVDNLIQRLSEVLQSFPSIPLWMALSAALPDHWTPLQIYFGIVIILSIVGWTSTGREVRGKILSLKEEDFVLAAMFDGCSTARIIRLHLIPSFMSHIIAKMTLSIPIMIIAETSLSFIGIGLQRPVVSWGVLLQQAQNIRTLSFSPWLLYPGLAVVVAVLAFNFLGDGLRDAADPYSAMT